MYWGGLMWMVARVVVRRRLRGHDGRPMERKRSMIAKPLETLVDGAFAQMFSRTPSDDEQLAEREETEALARQGTASFELANPTRRLRVNLVKNTKGFNHDSTFEIEAQLSEEQLYAYMDH